MMYASGDTFIKDFVNRTKENYECVAQYNKDYAVTQLINSTIGLLIIPQQKQFDKIANNLIATDLFEKILSCVISNSYDEDTNLSAIARHMRNSVSHARTEFVAEKPPLTSAPIQIHAVKFFDENPQKNEYFCMEVSIEILRDFLYAFSDSVANQGEKQ